MSYYFAKSTNRPFDKTIEDMKARLKDEGFGVLTEIDVAATLKKKLDVDFQPYVILGACNPEFAYKALQSEDKIGTMLPCNVIVQEHEDQRVEVAVIDPVASMEAVGNPELTATAQTVGDALRSALEKL